MVNLWTKPVLFRFHNLPLTHLDKIDCVSENTTIPLFCYRVDLVAKPCMLQHSTTQ